MKNLRRQDWILITILLIASLICIRLGFWQLDRLQQRIDRNGSIKARMNSAPNAFSPGLDDFTPVTITGSFRAEDQILLKNRSVDEVAGFHLVTPLQTQEGWNVLIDRGWIPYEEGAVLALAQYEIAGVVMIEGVLLPDQEQPRWTFLADPIPQPGEPPLKTWRLLDIDGIQVQTPYPLQDQYIALTRIEPGVATQPVVDFQPDLTNGPHLSYAIQWFSFGAIAIIGGSVLVRSRRRSP